MAVRFQGGKALEVSSAFRVNLASAKVGLNTVWRDVVKMVETSPPGIKSDPAFMELDRAFKTFDAALKKIEQKATGTGTNWQGR